MRSPLLLPPAREEPAADHRRTIHTQGQAAEHRPSASRARIPEMPGPDQASVFRAVKVQDFEAALKLYLIITIKGTNLRCETPRKGKLAGW